MTRSDRQRLLRSCLAACCLVGALWLRSSSATAAEPARRAQRAQAETDRLCAQLIKPDTTEQAFELVQRLAETRSAAATACLVQALLAGQADAVTDRILDALGETTEPTALDALVRFTRHRRAQARGHAYAALARARGAAAAAWLEHGLRDSDAGVRALAARALGEHGGASALDSLLRALGRGEAEAAIAIGKLGDAASLQRFAAYLGKQPLDVMLAGYQRYLERSDLDRATKLHIVATLEDITGEPVRAFMQSLLAQPSIAADAQLSGALRGSLSRLRHAGKPAAAAAAPRAEPSR